MSPSLLAPVPAAPAASSVTSAPRPRFLSEADCHDLLQRIARVTQGGGYTTVRIHSIWTGNVRWARNQVATSGEVRTNWVSVQRTLNGAQSGAFVLLNDVSDAGLTAAARRAERLAQFDCERPQSDLAARYQPEPLLQPKLFSEATYQLDAERRAAAARQLAQSAVEAGMLSAGYIEVSAHGQALLDTLGRAWYFPYTQAQYSVTVRDPKGTGSGWAGVDWYDWAKIDGPTLSQQALDKCLKSRNAVAVEPGRYTTILEPQAVCDFVGPMIWSETLDRPSAEYESGGESPFRKKPPEAPVSLHPGLSKLGDKVIDERLSITADPMDPELGIPPYDLWQFDRLNFHVPVYRPATWIKAGVLTQLSYGQQYGLSHLREERGLPNSGAFRLQGDGPTTSLEEMIATTKRGLLVTRFDQVMALDDHSQLYRGHTRDGLWLIENGKISKPIKNFMFVESVLVALNNVDQIGVPQRVFHPVGPTLFEHPQAVIVPALKVRDFSFTALDDAV